MKTNNLIRSNLFAAAILTVTLVVTALPAAAATVIYSSASSWSAAASSPTAINLQSPPAGITAPTTYYYGSNGVEGIVEGPTDGTEGSTYGAEGSVIYFASPGVTAVGADLSDFYGYGSQGLVPFVVTLSDGEVFTVEGSGGATTFFGFVSTTPISWVEFSLALPYYATDYVFVFNVEVTIPPSGSQIAMGPQAMEGNLTLSPGTTLQAGYDFTMPGNHPSATVNFVGANVTFAWKCASGPASGTLVVPMADQSYTDVQNSPDWYPSGDQNSSLVYQGSIAVPNACSGGLVSFRAGGTFSAGISSTDTTDKVNVRWHYSGNGSAGGWSGTKSVVPK
jgi:hypothetical protein